jgi:hypothetical protein
MNDTGLYLNLDNAVGGFSVFWQINCHLAQMVVSLGEHNISSSAFSMKTGVN